MEISMLMSKPEWRWLPQVPEDKSTPFCSKDMGWAPALCLALWWVLGQQRQINSNCCRGAYSLGGYADMEIYYHMAEYQQLQ